MDRIHAMAVLVQVADAGGFSQAARRLRVSVAAVSRTIGALEEHLGVRLFDRTTRVVRPTEAGRSYLHDCRRLLAEIAEADEAARGRHGEPNGELAVTASAMFGRMFVLPVILEYLDAHPRMQVRSLFLDRTLNLMDEGVDVAVRIGELQDSSLTATRVGAVRHVVCASPAYLERHGAPRTPDDLLQHRIIATAGPYSPTQWTFRREAGLARVQVAPRLTTVTNDAAIEAAASGHGLTRAISYQVASHLEAATLVTVLDGYEPPSMPIHVLHGGGRRAPAKTRAFVDLAVARLRARVAAIRP